MTTIRVTHGAGASLEVAVREHRLVLDQPTPDGDEAGPTPVELFVAGLAACVTALAGRYLARHGLDAGGLAVSADYEVVERPSRVARVRLSVEVPPGLPATRVRGLLAVASHCTVHNSLTAPPEIHLSVAGGMPDTPAGMGT